MAFLSNIGKSGDVAERSPAVISANLKEDMLLHKKMVVLNRSEHSMVHQIQVDQKVLYKRFQAKLIRSRLANARLLGQRELQRELRAKNLGGLNTDIVGQCDEDYGFLKLLEKRPCTANSLSPSVKEPPKSATPHRTNTRGSKDREPIKASGRSASARARYHRQLADDKNADAASNETNTQQDKCIEPTVPQRPATSSGSRVEKEFVEHQHSLKSANTIPRENRASTIDSDISSALKENHDIENVDSEEHSYDNEKSDDDEGPGEKQEDEQKQLNEQTDQVANVDDTDGTKKPAVAFLDEIHNTHDIPDIEVRDLDIEEVDTPLSPSQLSRRASRGADFFQEEKKIDMISLRLQRVKSLDYTTDVQKFCDDLEEMKGGTKQPSVDYYAMRLQLSQETRIEKPLAHVPGTPEDENKRSVGNLFIRSMTVPKINWDFASE